MPHSEWHEEHDAELRRLQAESLSSTQIAEGMRRLRPGITRNAVIGRLTRLGLSLISNEAERARASTVRAAKKRRARARQPSIAFPSPITRRSPQPPPPDGVSLFDARWDGGMPAQCRWPLNHHDPIANFRFCGGHTVFGSSWCEAHQKMAYTRLAQREREAAE